MPLPKFLAELTARGNIAPKISTILRKRSLLPLGMCGKYTLRQAELSLGEENVTARPQEFHLLAVSGTSYEVVKLVPLPHGQYLPAL